MGAGTRQSTSAAFAHHRRRAAIGGVVAVVVVVLVVVVAYSATGGSSPPWDAEPPSDIIEFTVLEDRGLGTDSWGVDLRVDDSATKEEVTELGNWLLNGLPEDGKLLVAFYNSREQVAVLTNFSWGSGQVRWLAER